MGYLNSEEETRNAFTSDFRLRTGDLAKVDKKQFFTITGKYKHLRIEVTKSPLQFMRQSITTFEEIFPQYISISCLMMDDNRNLILIVVIVIFICTEFRSHKGTGDNGWWRKRGAGAN